MKTNTGRIVYNRKVHMFAGSDVLRILESIYKSKNWKESSTFFADILSRFLTTYDISIQDSLYMEIVLLKTLVDYYGISLHEIIRYLATLYDEITDGTATAVDVYLT